MDTVDKMARMWTNRVAEEVEANRGVPKMSKGCQLIIARMCSFILESWKGEAEALEGDADINFKTLYAMNKEDAQAIVAAIAELLCKTSRLDFSFMGHQRPTDVIQ